MTAPPFDTDAGRVAATAQPAAALVLRHRADFLRAAQARRAGTPGFTLQARERRADEPGGPAIRVGFTCSKKIGNAVTRNRAKRRLRALVRAVLSSGGRPGWDYVLVGRPEATVAMPFAVMLADLARAFDRVHRDPGQGGAGRPHDSGGKA